MRMDNSNKIILDLCGGTGAWSKPYKDAGYHVVNITLPRYDVTKTIVSPALICFLDQEGNRDICIGKAYVYGILAAPPCTMFSFARNNKRARAPRDFYEGLITVDACLKIVRMCQQSGSLKLWAMENPRGYLRRFIGKPYLKFNPCDYGDKLSKPTDLWGFFNKPRKKPVTVTGGKNRWSDFSRFTSKDKESPDCTDEYFKKVGGERRIIRRSITPAGFAEAFYKANR